jgi:hypothetical protein
MNKSHLLRILVAVHVLLTFASVGAEGFFGWTLPPVLADYSHSQFAGSPFSSPGGVLRLALLWTTSCLAFAAWISLVVFWRGARRLYVVSYALGLLLTLFSGAQVDTSVGAMFRELSAVVGGVIFGLVYFSDLARRFERAPAERTVSIGTALGARSEA